MNGFPGSPNNLKGAIIGVDLLNPLSSVITFQYNPETLTRTIQPQAATGEDKGEALRLKGPPVETIRLDIDLDATDQLEMADPVAVQLGIHPQLAALEMLVYPKSSLVLANTILLAAGTIEIVPMQAPLTLFVWGAKRVLPVRLTELSIVEEAHDVNLNPIRAKVSLSLRVLSYNDLPLVHPGNGLFLAHQVVKETLATLGSLNNVAAAAGGNIKLL